MNKTVAELLDYLQMPENEGQIQHLIHLKNLEHVDEIRNIRGFGGGIARFVLRFTRKHFEALSILAECKTPADIVAFKQTKHFQRIRNTQIGDGWENLEELKELKELERLKDL